MRMRVEHFGGIIFYPTTKVTLYMLGYYEFPEIDYLSAPEVVHVEVTRRCQLECKHCYPFGFGECEELGTKQITAEI